MEIARDIYIKPYDALFYPSLFLGVPYNEVKNIKMGQCICKKEKTQRTTVTVVSVPSPPTTPQHFLTFMNAMDWNPENYDAIVQIYFVTK